MTQPDNRADGFGVEFLGSPGSGKSTLANEFVRCAGSRVLTLRDAGHQALRRRLRASESPFARVAAFATGAALLRNVYPVTKYEVGAYNHFCARFPELSRATWQLISTHSEDPVRMAKLGKLWFKHCSRYQLITEQLGSAPDIVAPEGFLQKAVSLVTYGIAPTNDSNKEALEHYLDLVPLPRVLIWVDVAPETTLTRLAGRERTAPYPFSILSPDEQHRLLQHLREIQSRIVSLIEAKGVHVVVPGDRDTGDQLLHVIEGHRQ
ncbi:hypothetical protein [Aquisalimonas sp.]|uniref:hypothetical protein n=1 Tax=Aquisalimonas sp. TaxID=1872621 RepID=UPI0025C51981|nr:hypothetical protein [Aquisalimonas sp.]